MVHFNTNFARVHPDVADSPRMSNTGRGHGASAGVRFGGAAPAGEKQQAKSARSVAGSIAHAFRSVDPTRHAASFERVGNKSPEQKSKLSWMSKKAAVAARGMEQRLSALFGKTPSTRPQGHAQANPGPARPATQRPFGANVTNTANQAPSAAHHTHHAHHAHHAPAPARQSSAARAEQQEANALRSRIRDEIEQMRPGSPARNQAIERYEQLAGKPPKEAMAGLQSLHAGLEHVRVRNDIKAQIKQMPHGPAREAALKRYDQHKRFDEISGDPQKTLPAWKQFRAAVTAQRQNIGRPASASPQRPASGPAAHRPTSGFPAPSAAPSHSEPEPLMSLEEFREKLQAERDDDADHHGFAGGGYMGDLQQKYREYVSSARPSAHDETPRVRQEPAHQPAMSKDEFMAQLRHDREREAGYEVTGTVPYMGDAEAQWHQYAQPMPAASRPSAPASRPEPAREPLMSKAEFKEQLQAKRDAEAAYDNLSGGYMGDWEQKYREYVAASKG